MTALAESMDSTAIQHAREEPDERSLRRYVEQVASAVGVPPEGAWCQVDDPSIAYLVLDQRCPTLPDNDLGLSWSERTGWSVVVETDHRVCPLAYLGPDPVPDPRTVREFVQTLLAGLPAGTPSVPVVADVDVARRLDRYRQA